jgi:transcriptional regulator with XRE-family HTH domain
MPDRTGVPTIGDRLRRLRVARGLTLKELADQAGYSAGHLSKVERGLEPCDSRVMINALASALRVSPSDLLSEPVAGRDPIARQAHEGIERISLVLAHNRLGHPFRDEPRAWPELRADLTRFTGVLVPACDYVEQSQMLPDLIEGLYTTHATDPGHRRDSLVGLMFVLQHTAALLKNLGAHGMPHLAAMHMRYIADELEDPAWTGAAEWRVGQSSGGDRNRMLAVSLNAAEALSGNPDPRARHTVGMLHLNAALAAASLRKTEDARSHLSEARELVRATEGTPDFADMHFNLSNWTAWRVAVGVEMGEGPRVAELAEGVDVTQLPSAERRGMFYGDIARGLAQEKHTRAQAVMMMLAAEEAAPQRIRTNPYMRETVSDLLRRLRRDSVGRELRGLAWRMGLAA